MQLICHGLKDKDFTVDFVKHRVSIGYDSANGIVVDATGISGHHAIFAERDQNLFIQDYESLNGTYLNRKKIEGMQPVSPGDVIQIGVQQIKVEKTADADSFTLNFLSSILEEDNSEVSTAMTVLADANIKELLKSGRVITLNGETTTQIIVTSTKDIFIEGREVGKYIIEKRIGKGGMGEIYLARHKTLGTYRALKVLPKEIREDNAKFFDRFIREAKLAAEIKHPNVVGVMDVESDETFGFSYIVMEYIDGGSLRRILKSSSHLSEEQSVIIVEAIASALRAAEEHKIVHRDIKPDNIMFTRQGEIKLADLGIAKNDDEDNDLTKTNVMIGTPAYLSPEQVQNAKDVDSRADIYSLGATFYEMLTGQHPYPGKTTYEILHKLFSDPVPDPRKINPEISEASASIVMKMLAKDAGDRFQNASELLEVLEKTFPPHTPSETSELVKKAISGNCEGNATFRSGITMSYFAKKKFEKKTYAVLVSLLCVLIIIAGVAFFMQTQQMSNEIEQSKNIPVAVENVTQKTVPSVHSLPDAPVIPEQLYELEIKTSPEAEVRITSESGALSVYSADGNGRLKITQLKKGGYLLKISCKNHIAVSRKVNVESNQKLESVLVKDVKILTVQAHPGSKIKISGVENSERMLIVPENGFIEFPDLLTDTLFVRAELTGFEPYEQSVLLKQNQKISILQKKIKNSLMVKSVPTAHLELKQKSKTVYSGECDSSGTGSITNIDFGEYTLQVSCSGYYPQELMCDLTKNQNLIVSLKKILYDLEINSNPGAKIVLLKENQECGTYYMPDSGKMKVKALVPSAYAILAEKNGFHSNKFELKLKNNQSISCMLTEKSIPTPLIIQKNQTVPQPAVSAVAKQSTSKTPAPVINDTGEMLLLLDGSSAAINYGLKKAMEIKINDLAWNRITDIPYRTKLKQGRYTVTMRIEGMQPISSKQIQIIPGKCSEIVFAPRAYPATLTVNCNADKAKFQLNAQWRRCGESVTLEPFTDVEITISAPGYKSKRISYTAQIPGKSESVSVELQKDVVVLSLNPNYQIGEKALKAGNYQKAFEFFMLAANDGDVEGMYQIGKIYETGLGLSAKDKKAAYQFYKKAALKRHGDAAFCASLLLLNKDIPLEQELLIQFLKTAAEKNHAGAQYQLGKIYETGDYDIPKNLSSAAAYYRKSAEQGYAEAMFALGRFLEQQYEFKEAIMWYKKASQKGITRADDRLRILEKLK